MQKADTFWKEHWLFCLTLIVFTVWLVYSYASRGMVFSLLNSDVNAVVQAVRSYGIASYFIFVLLVVLECVLAPIPPLVLYIAGGLLFGSFWGGVLTLLGNILGAGIDFFLARKYARGLVEKKVDTRLRKKFDSLSERYGGFGVFLLRVNPLTTSDLVSYLAGLSKMKAGSFLLWTTAGLTPLIFLQTYIGEYAITQNPILYALVIAVNIFYVIIFVYLILILAFRKKHT